MIHYCRKCVMPATKPDLQFDDDGICSACHYIEAREGIDWDERQEHLKKFIREYQADHQGDWDCIIPSSGGKDSTYQALMALELGLNPLIVTATTCDLSEIGRYNIEALKKVGVDTIEVSPDPIVRRRLNRIGLERVGDISWPEHVGMFTIPVRIAVKFKIPLLLWGENSQNEYGGPDHASQSPILDRRWLEEFGGLNGMRVTDLIGSDGFTEKNLAIYTYPHHEDLERVGIKGLFLGHYYPWDGYTNALIAQAHGFSTFEHAVEGSLVNYENLDNYQTGIHDYFKFLKYGFGRTTDQACLHVRRDRLTREQAMALVTQHDGKFPHSYLGKPLEEILRPLEISIDDFIVLCDRFTNKALFKTDRQGNLIKDRDGNLKKINDDNV